LHFIWCEFGVLVRAASHTELIKYGLYANYWYPAFGCRSNPNDLTGTLF